MFALYFYPQIVLEIHLLNVLIFINFGFIIKLEYIEDLPFASSEVKLKGTETNSVSAFPKLW